MDVVYPPLKLKPPPLKLVSFLLLKRYIRNISFFVGKTFINVCA